MNKNFIKVDDALLDTVSGGVFDPTEHTIAVDSSNYNSVVCLSPTVILLFGAGWASSCVKLRKLIESLAFENITSSVVGIVDIDKSEDLCMKLNVTSIPMTIKFLNGIEVCRVPGYQSVDTYKNLF